MRGLTRRWLPMNSEGLSDGTPPEKGWGLEPLAWRVLRSRGLADPEAARAFCQPRLTELHDPSRLPDLDSAAARLLDALRRREPIIIYGDYDTDGITATAILYHTLRGIDPEAVVSTYTPHRLDEGYGLHGDALIQLAAEGARVVVTVDCGVTAFEAALEARKAGLDLIITDHHNLRAEEALHAGDHGAPGRSGAIPQAFAVIHPRRADSEYPFGDLCGAGVAFKLAWRLATMASGGDSTRGDRVEAPMRERLLDMLALAALGTIADVVPLVGENRIIARHGLARLRHTGLEGLSALIEASGLGGESIDAEQVGFRLAPRLNACGRLGHAGEAVELLTTATGARADEIAASLTRVNEQRQRTERAIAAQAERMAEEAGMTGADRRAIVLAHPEWHPGVVGIVCSRLVEKFHRPTILLHDEGGDAGLCKGSGRSIDGYNLHGGLAACAHLLDRYGGHDAAAGLALRRENLDAFREAFTAHAGARLGEEHLIAALRADCAAPMEELTQRGIEQLAKLGPFGRGNPMPMVLLRDLRLARPAEAFGAHGAHLNLFVRSGSREMRLIAWRWGERARDLPGGLRVDAIIDALLERLDAHGAYEIHRTNMFFAEDGLLPHLPAE
ncbi:MAG: single-stranded-DNA-specific exonuclease RecJ [Planctomycetes bacterium HGW-Planctomycetes-2]|nr:MAG: single-stranded-DNA-specific exonuclease RecJ [Planctomycetes bacterium HGW-Planctomycetes-2]